MIYKICPFIIHHRTSITCSKLFFEVLQQRGSKTYKTLHHAVKLTNASSKGSLTCNRTLNLTVANCQISYNVIRPSQKSAASPQPTPNKDKPDVPFDNRNPEENFLIYKSVPKPDVITPSINETNKENDENKNPETVQILNVINAQDIEWHKITLDLKQLAGYYMSLAKIRLTGLVVLTTLAGYGMAPGPVDSLTLICALLGTGLTSAAANAINQLLEIPYDSQMARTKNRVLIRGLLSPLHVFGFAVCSATLGISTLYFCTNPLTTILGITNLVLYTSVYTPLKRCSILNTWVGSVVGAIPPLIGWSACTGSLSAGALLMGAILYSWQFPHFNALSWNLRRDYSRAGYRMTAVVNPQLCRSAALRHSIAIFIFCCTAPLFDLTTWTFAIDSMPLNSYLIYRAFQFYKHSDSQSSRKLFRLSLIHLPALMLLMFVGKKRVNKEENKIDNL